MRLAGKDRDADVCSARSIDPEDPTEKEFA